MPFVLKRGRALGATSTVQIGRHVVVFKRVVLRTGESAMLAEVDDEVGEAVERYSSLFVLLDADPTQAKRARLVLATQDEVPAGTTPNAAPGGYPAPVAAALRNGWTYDDMTGSGRGDDWGPGGGTGMRSGLTMAEMAISTPPADWKTKSADHFPWEVLGWKPPGEGWKPPAGGVKRQPEKEPETVIAPEEPASTGEPGAGAEPDATDEDIEVGGAEPNLDGAVIKPATVDAEAALKDYTADEREQILQVLVSVWRDSGKPPTRSKLNNFLKKAALPQVKTDEALAALVDIAPV